MSLASWGEPSVMGNEMVVCTVGAKKLICIFDERSVKEGGVSGLPPRQWGGEVQR